ncbi:MAG: WYL domain-containing protein [Verrucomicrobia subdivision 3 bacterium]|nr:WYL domain-containing protein [Limisphaerales bacterium]
MSKNSVQQRRGNALKKENRSPAAALSPGDGNEADTVRVGRNATERLLAIHQLISAKRYPNTARLAREFDVSQKTIKRDVEWMRVHWDLPIEYDRERHGYFYSREVKQFPGVPTITEAEMFAMLVAHKAVEQYSGTPFHKPLQMAFRKLTGQLDDKERYTLQDTDEVLSFRPFAPEATDMERFEIVARAIQQRRALRFMYRKPGEKRAEGRHIHPYHLTCNNNRWYLIGYDVDRNDIRTFALARMNDGAVLSETFQKPKDFSVAKYLRGSLTVMSGRGDYEVVIEFDAWATDQLRGRLWHSSQQVTELPGGESRMRMRLSGLEEVERWVLSWGTHATVISPQSLVERVSTIARSLAGCYETP